MLQRKWSKASMKTLQAGFGLSLHHDRDILDVLAGWCVDFLADAWRLYMISVLSGGFIGCFTLQGRGKRRGLHIWSLAIYHRTLPASRLLKQAKLHWCIGTVSGCWRSQFAGELCQSRTSEEQTSDKIHSDQAARAAARHSETTRRPLTECTFCEILPVSSWKRLTHEKRIEEKSLRSIDWTLHCTAQTAIWWSYDWNCRGSLCVAARRWVGTLASGNSLFWHLEVQDVMPAHAGPSISPFCFFPQTAQYLTGHRGSKLHGDSLGGRERRERERREWEWEWEWE